MAIFIYIAIAYISIFIHELGHYLSAFLLGIKAETVTTGMGFNLIKIKSKHTAFIFKIFPGGGMTTFREKDLEHISAIKSLIILASGVFLNYLTAGLAMSLYLKTTILQGFEQLNLITIKFLTQLVQLLNIKTMLFPEGTITDSVQQIADNSSTTTFILFLFIFMNLILFIFNLLPIPFFDGGQIISIIFDPLLLAMGISERILDYMKLFINRLVGFALISLILIPFLYQIYLKITLASNPLKEFIKWLIVLIITMLLNRLFIKHSE
ncbi:MAG TPA: peptidase M50 [Firmicutes bacterium]|nr:peptidase M50 [Bacillota bacterium]